MKWTAEILWSLDLIRTARYKMDDQDLINQNVFFHLIRCPHHGMDSLLPYLKDESKL
jgi:hypothetical protein